LNLKSEEMTQSEIGIITPEKSNYGEKKFNMRAMLEPGGILDSKYINTARNFHSKRFSADSPTTTFRDPVHRLRQCTVQSRQSRA
jgi:hypothetical protein